MDLGTCCLIRSSKRSDVRPTLNDKSEVIFLLTTNTKLM